MKTKELTTDNGMLINVCNKIIVRLVITPRWICHVCAATNYGTPKHGDLSCWKCSHTFPKTMLRPDPKAVSAIKKILHKSSIINIGGN